MYPEVALLSSELPLMCPEVTYPRWLRGCFILLRIKWGLNAFGFKSFSGLSAKDSCIYRKSENPADQKIFIRFSINNVIANVSLYVLSWP